MTLPVDYSGPDRLDSERDVAVWDRVLRMLMKERKNEK